MDQKIFFQSNIKFLRERRKITQEGLAKSLGITRVRLAALEAGNTKAPQPEDYLNFSNFFKVSIDTLLKIDMKILGELKLRELEAGKDVYIRGGNLRVVAISVDRRNNENVEYVPVKAKAGYLSGFSDPEFIASLPKYSLPMVPADGTYRLFPVTGDSMLPIPDGSIITAKFIQDWTTIKPLTPCIVILNNAQDFVFKMIKLTDSQLYLKSLNPIYDPYSVDIEDILEIWEFHSYMSTEFPQVTDLNQLMLAIRDIQSAVNTIGRL